MFKPGDKMRLPGGMVGEVRSWPRKDGMVLVTITAWGLDIQVHKSELEPV